MDGVIGNDPAPGSGADDQLDGGTPVVGVDGRWVAAGDQR
jgi:hypothetical protein